MKKKEYDVVRYYLRGEKLKRMIYTCLPLKDARSFCNSTKDKQIGISIDKYNLRK